MTREYVIPALAALFGLIVVIVGANVAADYHAIECSVPIEELSWIGAGSCDRVAEWYRSATS